MGLTAEFRDFVDSRNKNLAYSDLVEAIKAPDRKRVAELLEKGVDPLYAAAYYETPLQVAVVTGDAGVFRLLLQNPKVVQEVATGRASSDVVENIPEKGTVYFEPSYLYKAIQSGNEYVALQIASLEQASVENSGHFSTSWSNEAPGKYSKSLKTPLALAQEKGMTRLVLAIEERMKPLLDERKRQAAKDMLERAAKLREEADRLEQEAAALVPPAPVKPAQPRKLNV